VLENAISLVFAHRMMEHPKLVAQDLLRRKNDARHLGVAEVGVGGDKSAHVAKIHQPFNDLSMLGQVLCGWIINQKMRFFPPVEGIDTAAPSLYRLGKLHLIDQRLQQRIGLDLDVIRDGSRAHIFEYGSK